MLLQRKLQMILSWSIHWKVDLLVLLVLTVYCFQYVERPVPTESQVCAFYLYGIDQNITHKIDAYRRAHLVSL